MLFHISEQQEQHRQKVREFAEKVVKPVAFKLDQASEFPKDIVKQMGELGFLGVPFPKEYGGQGLDNTCYAITVEELSRVDGGVGVICSAHTSLGAWPIFGFGTEEQKQKYLTPLAKGEKIGAFGLTEPNAGSDAGGTETTAVLDGDNYILNGTKIFITNGKEADTYVIFASTDPSKGVKGISAFIVEKGWEGFTFPTQYDKLGIRSSITSELNFKNVKVPKENLLGELGEGFKIAMATLDGGRIGIGAQGLGIAQGAYEEALAYVKEREQFGAPVAIHQGVSFKIADMATAIEASRMMIYRAAEIKTAGKGRYTKEAAMGKLMATDTAEWVTSEALQLHGGNGFIKGLPVERHYRDAKITQIYEGTNEIMRLVISSQLLGRLGKKKDAPEKKTPKSATGERKNVIFSGSPEEQAKQLVEALKADGYTFGGEVDIYAPVAGSTRCVAAGQGLGDKSQMPIIEALAKACGAVVGSSRPAAEMHEFTPIDRYIGLSGQNFDGELYIACGISGARQHLRGIRDAKTIVAINKDPDAPIFINADYGLVGDLHEIVPALTKVFLA